MKWTWLKTLFWCLIIFDISAFTGIPRICKKTVGTRALPLCFFPRSLGVVMQLSTSFEKVKGPEFKNTENTGQVT